MNMLIYFLLQAAARTREGEERVLLSAFCSEPRGRALPSCMRLAERPLALVVNPYILLHKVGVSK